MNYRSCRGALRAGFQRLFNALGLPFRIGRLGLVGRRRLAGRRLRRGIVLRLFDDLLDRLGDDGLGGRWLLRCRRRGRLSRRWCLSRRCRRLGCRRRRCFSRRRRRLGRRCLSRRCRCYGGWRCRCFSRGRRRLSRRRRRLRSGRGRCLGGGRGRLGRRWRRRSSRRCRRLSRRWRRRFCRRRGRCRSGRCRRCCRGRFWQRHRGFRVRPQEGDNGGALLVVGYAGEGHRRSGCKRLRILQPAIELLKGPIAFMRLQRGRVVETLDRGDLASDHAIEIGTHQRAAALVELVAHLANPSIGFALFRVRLGDQLEKGCIAARRFAGLSLGCRFGAGVASGSPQAKAEDCRSWCAGRPARRRAASHREVRGTAPSWSPARRRPGSRSCG